jgi:hypothetical protein
VITGLIGSLVGALVLERLGTDLGIRKSADEPRRDGHAWSSNRGIRGPYDWMTGLVEFGYRLNTRYTLSGFLTV